MIINKLHFPVFSLLLLLLGSCNPDKKHKTAPKTSYQDHIVKALQLEQEWKYDSAFYYFNKAKLSCSEDEKEKIIYALYNIAVIQQNKCDYSGSEETATEALKTDPQHNKNINSIYNLLGIAYQEQFDYLNALKYYTLSLNATKSEIQKCIIKNNIGYVLLESQKYKAAAKILNEILQNEVLIEDRLNYAKVLDNLGYAHFKLNDQKALPYLTQSLHIRDSLKDDFELIPSYIHLSEYYQSTNPKLAKDFALKAYQSATKTSSSDERVLSLKFLIQNSDSKDIKSLALKQMSISDSNNKVRLIAKNQFAKIKYDSSVAVQEGEKQKSEKQFFILLFVFVSLLSVVVFFAIRFKNNLKLKKITYETETRISKKLHDELANDLFNAMTYADTQNLNEPNKKEVLVENLDKIYIQARNISKENSEIDTSENFENILKDMLSSYNSNAINVIINKSASINWLKIKKETKIVHYRILQELMVNMKKHSQCSLAVISFENHKNTVAINYSDNGIGSPELLNLKRGLQNVENRVESINGTITFETAPGKGFKARMIVPK